MMPDRRRTTDDLLVESLHDADRIFRAPIAPPAFEQLERCVSRRRTVRKRVGGMTATVGALVIGTVIWWSVRPPAVPVAQAPHTPAIAGGRVDAAAVRAELASLEAEAEQHLANVRLIRRHRGLVALEDEVDRLEAELKGKTIFAQRLAVEREVERAAAASLMYARRLAEGNTQLAALQYRRIVERYPQTVWSQTAAAALASLEGQM